MKRSIQMEQESSASDSGRRWWLSRHCFAAALLLIEFAGVAQVSNIYSTGFELSENFDISIYVDGPGRLDGH